jgi:hypothetical protein
LIFFTIMRQLQIAVKVGDWDGSVIYALGREVNGRKLVPCGLVARELPEPWLTVWHGLVDALRGVAPGEWAATFITAELTAMPLPEDAEPDTEPPMAVALVVHRRWDDGTTAEPVELVLAEPVAVGFFESLYATA